MFAGNHLNGNFVQFGIDLGTMVGSRVHLFTLLGDLPQENYDDSACVEAQIEGLELAGCVHLKSCRVSVLVNMQEQVLPARDIVRHVFEVLDIVLHWRLRLN